MSTLLAVAMSLGSKSLACLVLLVSLWAGLGPAPAATWQEHRDAGVLAFANADYMASAEHLESAFAAADEGRASDRERGVILERLTTSYLATRWFRRARTTISRWDGILEASPDEPWVSQQRSVRDRLAVLVTEVIGAPEPEAKSPLPAPPSEAAGETPAGAVEADEGPPFEAAVDVPFSPDVALPVGLAADQTFEAVKQASPAPPAESVMSAVSAAGGYAIHLVSLTSQEGVDGSWAKLQGSYPELLAGKDLQVRQVDLGDRGIFYRLHASPFAASEIARTTCEKLRSLDQYCAVVDLE